MTVYRNHFEETTALLRDRDSIAAMARNMSAQGLHDAIVTHVTDLPIEAQRWVFGYIAELRNRAEIADRPGFLRGHPLTEGAA